MPSPSLRCSFPGRVATPQPSLCLVKGSGVQHLTHDMQEKCLPKNFPGPSCPIWMCFLVIHNQGLLVHGTFRSRRGFRLQAEQEKRMKRLLKLLSKLVTLVTLFTGITFAQTKYVITNDDTFPTNTASIYSVGSGGALTLVTTIATGGEGNTGGYFGTPRVNVLRSKRHNCA